MDVLLDDMKRTLGAKRVYLPGSAEEARYLSRMNGKHIVQKEDSKIEELEIAVEGLGIVDSAVDMTQAVGGARRSRLELPPINTSGESDKENLPVLRSRMIKVKEGRGGQLEMVGVP
jgi:hypothetical protein